MIFEIDIRNEEEKSRNSKPVSSSQNNNNSNNNNSRVSNSRPGRADKEEKVDRLAAMQKISDTFGYGEGKKTSYQRPAPVASGSGGPGPAERKQLAAESALAHKNKIQQVLIPQVIFTATLSKKLDHFATERDFSCVLKQSSFIQLVTIKICC